MRAADFRTTRRITRSSRSCIERGELTLRIAYNLFTQKPKQEKEDFARWIKMTGPGKGDDFLPLQRRRRNVGVLRSGF